MIIQKLDQLSLLFFCIFLITCSLSVSISQISFSISLFFILAYWLASKKMKSFFYFKIPLIVFSVAFANYLFIFFSTIQKIWMKKLQGLSDLEFWKSLGQGEFSDFWMAFAILIGYWHSKEANKQKSILISFYIGLGLCILSGFISVFTPYRLSKFIQYGFQYPEGERLQHFAGSLFSIPTYLPIGLQATHLTYGGILGLLVVGGLFYLLHYQPRWKGRLTFIIILIFAGFLIFYNQSRSIWIGILFLLFQLMIFFLYRKKIQGSRFLRYLFFIIFLISIGFYSGKVLYEKNWLIQRGIQDLTKKISTENQRYFIYKHSLKLLFENWFLGIGNNQFSKEWWNQAEKTIEENEWLWYELEITPRSHAHNDFLHFWITGGVFSALSYLTFWVLIWAKFYMSLSILNYQAKIQPNEPQKPQIWFLGLGVLILFPASFFQCFFLDDEVALPFYSLVGIFFSDWTQMNQKEFKKKKYYFYGFIPTLLLTCANMLFWIYRTSLPVDENYVHKRKIIEKDHLTKVIHIEGCLSHRFQKNSQIYLPRKEDYYVQLTFLKRQQRKDMYPYKIQVELWDRDTFDQDKLYKAHESRKLEERIFLEGKTWPKNLIIQFSEPIQEPSTGFPGTIRFRDFQFLLYYKEGTTKHYPPTILIQNLCQNPN